MQVTVLNRFRLTNGYLVVASVTFSASYPAGGEAVTPNQFGLSVISSVGPNPAGGYQFEWDAQNQKVKAMQYDYAAAGAGPAVEVPGGTDLSAVTTQVAVIGY